MDVVAWNDDGPAGFIFFVLYYYPFDMFEESRYRRKILIYDNLLDINRSNRKIENR